MSRTQATVSSWSLWAVGVAAMVTAAVLTSQNPPILSGQPSESALEGGLFLSTWVGFGLVGAVIVSRRPDNRIGWILSGITPAVGVGLLLPAYARYALVAAPGTQPLGEVAAWLGTWTFFPLAVLVVSLGAMFPTGSVRTRIGIWGLRAFAAVAIVDAAVYAIRPGPIEGDTPPHNPLGLEGTRAAMDSATEVLGMLLALLAMVVVVDAVLRYRRSTGRERMQFRWFMFSVALFPVLFVTAIVLDIVLGLDQFNLPVVAFAVWGNGTAFAIGAAVTRHGLFDIDRIISRTVSYGVVTATLLGVFLSSVFVLSNVLPFEEEFLTAISTLAVAALFNPLRTRVQAVVDRRFNRSRYDAARIVTGFADRLRSERGLVELANELQMVAAQTMQPESLSLWLQEEET